MIRRANQSKHGAPPADLLVCFPSRAHLTLMPKQICSQRLRHLKKVPSTRLGSVGQTSSSPLSWANKASTAGSDVSEPTSPKVTCAGQIKVRPRSAASCKSWQSVIEEIERIHKNNKKQKKRASWGDALGFKKEVMQFLTCLRNIKIDFTCFGAMPECDLSSDEDEDDEEADDANHKKNINQILDNKEANNEDRDEEKSRTAFSKWFMVLQENEEQATTQKENKKTDAPSAAPPPNALLLMRCKSAPANRAEAVVEQEERDERTQQTEEEEEEERIRKIEQTAEKQRKKLRDYLVVMEYDTNFHKLSRDIAKETWVVGSMNPSNPFSRSRSWKR